jgi:hypothetical protein
MFYYNEVISFLNTSPVLAGLAMLMLNIGSKYVEVGLSKSQEEALRAGLAREMLIFAMVYMGTKDIILSIIMTASFIVLSDHFFNEESSLCMCPSYLKKIRMEIDLNKDDKITDEEVERARKLLKQADQQRSNGIMAAFAAGLNASPF